MANPNSMAAMDLGLGAAGMGEGDMLSQQVDDEETKRKKKLLQLGGEQGMQGAAGSMGLAAMNLLGAFRG